MDLFHGNPNSERVLNFDSKKKCIFLLNQLYESDCRIRLNPGKRIENENAHLGIKSRHNFFKHKSESFPSNF